MKILHISAECYPAAKTGGLGDVVGSLPKYQKALDIKAQVIIPKYGIPWINHSQTEIIHGSEIDLGGMVYPLFIEVLKEPDLGFDLLYVSIPGLFDRNGIYGDEGGFFQDEFKRVVAFNRGVLQWICLDQIKIDVIHCHDHHTGLIPFFTGYVDEFAYLKDTPNVFTIHNGKYQGRHNWDQSYFLPHFDPALGGLIEWNHQINCLAAGVKGGWKVTTVSESYLAELRVDSDGLEWLFNNEISKSIGILNGIDTVYWDPKMDRHIHYPLKSSIPRYKERNKTYLANLLNTDSDNCFISFIGRLVHEKGIDFLIDLYSQFCKDLPNIKVQFIILGTGSPEYESQLVSLQNAHPDKISLLLKYDEKLAHQIYAGSDFIFMPSRIEPCGLNQFYALRYGTMPIVRKVGGLADSVIDIKQNGNGIVFSSFNILEGKESLEEASYLYNNKDDFAKLRAKVMQEDHSWENAVLKYLEVYKSIIT